MSNDFNTPADKRERTIRVKGLAALPSLFTIGNGIAGFAAIVELAKAYACLQLDGHKAVASESMLYAAIYIGLAMVFDALDGRIARMTGTAGDFGAELDSLCDAVSFGVAPAFFLRVFGEALFGTGLEKPPESPIRLLWAASALYLACTVLRLARFNVETGRDDDHKSFRGLPSPAAAAACVSLFLLSYSYRDLATGQLAFGDTMTVLIPLCGSIFALLMVSRVRYQHLLNRMASRRRSIGFLVLIVTAIIGFCVVNKTEWPVVVGCGMLTYVASGPVISTVSFVRALVRKRRRKGGPH